MAKSAVVYSSDSKSDIAGAYIGEQIRINLGDRAPDVVIVFASSRYDYHLLLESIKVACHPKLIVGSSSAGEFTSQASGEGSVSAVAITSDNLQFSVGIGRNIREHPDHAAKQMLSGFKGLHDHSYPYRSALLLTDALAGYTDALVDEINLQTAGSYQFFGGGAGDDAKFSKTHVFIDTEAVTDAIVALEILSKSPVGLGTRHGWEPAGEPMRVTESESIRLISLNAVPALEIFQDYATSTSQQFDPADPVPFFLHNVLGIKTPNGYQLRVPLAVNDDGSISLASDIPTGAIVNIMRTTTASAAEAASSAAKDALSQVNNPSSAVSLVFDCAATRLRTGRGFASELDQIGDSLPGIPFAGCNTYGQISRVDGQFNGFHNCTAVVGVIPL